MTRETNIKLTQKDGATYAKVSDLRKNEDNPRTIEGEDFQRLIQQLKLGEHSPLLITADGEVLGGNTRLAAYEEVGKKEAQVVVVEFKETDEGVKAIVNGNEAERTFSSIDAAKLEYALSHNDAIGTTDHDKLAELTHAYEIPLEVYKVTGQPYEVKDIHSSVGPEDNNDDGGAPEVERGEAYSELGKIYELGRHRVMCGDSTAENDVAGLVGEAEVGLVLTDPPYGISIVGDNHQIGAGNIAKNKKYKAVEGDGSTDAAERHYEVCVKLDLEKRMIIFGGNYFLEWLPISENWLVWDKRGEMTSNNFADGELAWTNIKTPVRIYKHIWNGMIREGQDGEREHPTQKPTEMLANILRDFSKDEETVFDGFLGSGSTLIACELNNRTCYGMEIDPHYVDVIRKRYAKLFSDDDEVPENWQELTPEVE